jgi:hypothetical protein
MMAADLSQDSAERQLRVLGRRGMTLDRLHCRDSMVTGSTGLTTHFEKRGSGTAPWTLDEFLTEAESEWLRLAAR